MFRSRGKFVVTLSVYSVTSDNQHHRLLYVCPDNKINLRQKNATTFATTLFSSYWPTYFVGLWFCNVIPGMW